MKDWENFEIDCTNYLNKKFGKYAKFIHQGGADSTVPDILVKAQNGSSFYIDAKKSPAQCGQFVLLPDYETGTFRYSDRNANKLTSNTKIIISYMNEYFDIFKEAGTAGQDINFHNDSDIFADWIIQSYFDKGVRFFITNNYTLFPIEQFNKYFNITAKYRVKKSGSSNVGKNKMELILNYILSQDYMITASYTIKDKLFVTSPKPLNNTHFIVDEKEYMFSKRDNNYEIRKLSPTSNANVIFSIIKNSSISGMDDCDFIKFLI